MEKNFISLNKFKNKVNLGFFKSNGGVSKGHFFSLNCSKNNTDKKTNVIKNRKIAIDNLGIKNKKLKLINQTHSNKVFVINSKNFNKNFFGDGLITKNKNIALGILTADCAPIFIFDNKKKIVCCLHSGWRGALNNIVKESIKIIKKLKIEINDINAVIGPCLSVENFEVDKDFKLQFIKKNESYSNFFKSKNLNKDYFNLRKLINFQLQSENINKIHNIGQDTYKNDHCFFSHRRATHMKKLPTGRMINIISLKD